MSAASPCVLSAVVTTELGRFSVHARWPRVRGALQRLIRYGLRPPWRKKRRALTAAGKVCYPLRKPYFDGRTEVVQYRCHGSQHQTIVQLRATGGGRGDSGGGAAICRKNLDVFERAVEQVADATRTLVASPIHDGATQER